MTMELQPTMNKTEARQFSNVLNQVVFHDQHVKPESGWKLTDSQKAVAKLAIAQLRADTDSDTVALNFEQEQLGELAHVANAALDNPSGVMYGLIAPELDMDDTFHYDQRGNALRSLAVAADFVEAVRPWSR
jgi:hypothetical protein